MTTVTIRPPEVLNFEQQRLAVGDTFQFLDKMNATQSKLETFSSEILTFVSDIESAINVIDQIATNSADDAANGVVTNLTQIRDQMLQVKLDTEGMLNQIQQSFDSAMAQISSGQTDVLESIALLSSAKQQSIEELSNEKLSSIEELSGFNHQSIQELSAERIEVMQGLASFAEDEADRAAGLAASFALPTEAALPGGVIVQNEEGSGFEYKLFDYGSLPWVPIKRVMEVILTTAEGVKGGGTWSVTVDTVSYLSGVTVDQLEVTWWNGVETITVTGASMTIERVTPDYPADPVTVSVRALDSLGNKSKLETIQTAIVSNTPPTGPITINHQTSIVEFGDFDVAFSGATDPDNDVTLTYEVVDDGGLTFTKTTGILAGEIVSVTAPYVSHDTDITFSVRATDGDDYTNSYSSVISVLAAQVIGVKMVATGNNGGIWSHIDKTGAEIATPTTGFFNSNPIFGGIVDQMVDGQYMVKIPKFYYRRGTAADGKPSWWISDKLINGYEVFPAFILNGVEVDQFWYGKYHASYSNSKLQSVPNVYPQTNINLSESINYAEARNTGGVAGFRLHHYDMWLAIQWLYLVENGSMDSQGTTGQGSNPGEKVDSTAVAQATYRGMVGLWNGLYLWMDGLRTMGGVIERRSYTGDWVSTGETIPNSGGVTYPLTFRTTAPDQFIPDTYLTGNSGATLPDYVRLKAQAYPYVGSGWGFGDSGGLWSIDTSYETFTYGSLGARLARIV